MSITPGTARRDQRARFAFFAPSRKAHRLDATDRIARALSSNVHDGSDLFGRQFRFHSSLRGPLVHPRPDFGYLGVDLFERIAQRGQRLESSCAVKAPEVGGAGVSGVFEESEPGPHPGGPIASSGWRRRPQPEHPRRARQGYGTEIQISLAPAESLRFMSSAHRSISG